MLTNFGRIPAGPGNFLFAENVVGVVPLVGYLRLTGVWVTCLLEMGVVIGTRIREVGVDMAVGVVDGVEASIEAGTRLTGVEGNKVFFLLPPADETCMESEPLGTSGLLDILISPTGVHPAVLVGA